VRLHAPAVEQLQVNKVAGSDADDGGQWSGQKGWGKYPKKVLLKAADTEQLQTRGKQWCWCCGWDEWCDGCVRLGGAFVRQLNEATVYHMRVVW